MSLIIIVENYYSGNYDLKNIFTLIHLIILIIFTVVRSGNDRNLKMKHARVNVTTFRFIFKNK